MEYGFQGSMFSEKQSQLERTDYLNRKVNQWILSIVMS